MGGGGSDGLSLVFLATVIPCSSTCCMVFNNKVKDCTDVDGMVGTRSKGSFYAN